MEQDSQSPSAITSENDADKPSTSSTGPEVSGPKKPKKLLIAGIVLAIPLVIVGALIAKEYIRAKKFTSGVKKVQSSGYYKDYLKNTDTYLKSDGSAYVNYRTCNVVSLEALWNFKQPVDAKYYFGEFSMVYNTLEGNLRGEQSDIKKNIPGEYKKSNLSGIARQLDRSIHKRQQILDLTNSMEVLFNSNDYMDYCYRVIYSNTIDRLSFIEVNASSANTVVSGRDSEDRKKQTDDVLKALEEQTVPAGFEAVHRQFLSTVRAVSTTYAGVLQQNNTSESAKKNREAFQAHKMSLEKDLKDLAEAAKPKISVQPDKLAELLRTVEE